MSKNAAGMECNISSFSLGSSSRMYLEDEVKRALVDGHVRVVQDGVASVPCTH